MVLPLTRPSPAPHRSRPCLVLPTTCARPCTFRVRHVAEVAIMAGAGCSISPIRTRAPLAEGDHQHRPQRPIHRCKLALSLASTQI